MAVLDTGLELSGHGQGQAAIAGVITTTLQTEAKVKGLTACQTLVRVMAQVGTLLVRDGRGQGHDQDHGDGRQVEEGLHVVITFLDSVDHMDKLLDGNPHNSESIMES